MTTIYALIVCTHLVNEQVCKPVFTYEPAEACKNKQAALLKEGPQPDRSDARLNYHCASKTVPTWQPVK